MKNQTRTVDFAICAILLFSIASVSSYVYAEEIEPATGAAFIGLRYANQDTEMATKFTRRTSGEITEISSFENRYTTNDGGLFVGYAIPYERFTISGQVFFDVYDREFDLSVGSSRITNAIDHAFGIDLMPGFYLVKDLSVFGIIGLVNGHFEFVKTSPTSTQYDIKRNLYGYTVGLGLSYDITPQFTAKIGYSQTQYEEIEINATLGTRNDKTLVEPQGESVFLTLQYNFH